MVDGVSRSLPEVLAQPILWQAVWTSLRIAAGGGRSVCGADRRAAVGGASYANASNYSPDKRWNSAGC